MKPIDTYYLFIQALNVINTVWMTNRDREFVRELTQAAIERFGSSPILVGVRSMDHSFRLIDGFRINHRDGLFVIDAHLTDRSDLNLRNMDWLVTVDELRRIAAHSSYGRPVDMDWSWLRSCERQAAS